MPKKLTIDDRAAMTARECSDSRTYLDKRLHELEERILQAIEGLEFKSAARHNLGGRRSRSG